MLRPVWALFGGSGGCDLTRFRAVPSSYEWPLVLLIEGWNLLLIRSGRPGQPSPRALRSAAVSLLRRRCRQDLITIVRLLLIVGALRKPLIMQ